MRKAVLTLMLGTLAAVPAVAQEEVYNSDATVQFFGSFHKQTTEDNIRHDAKDTGGVLATYRRFFNRNHGVEVNYGYSLNTHRYEFGGVSSGLKAHSNEATAAYVFRLPRDRWTPFASAGVGALVFAPDSIGDTQARAAFVYGAGADFNITPRFFVRAQYRGLFYNAPTLAVSTVGSPARYTHESRPSVGFGFRF